MKRNKDKRIFAKILIRYIICTVVFSIPLWVFGDRYLLLIEDVTGSESFYDIGTVIVTNLVLVLVITLIFMLRAARLLDREYDALDGIVDDDYVSPILFHQGIRTLRKRLKRNLSLSNTLQTKRSREKMTLLFTLPTI